ncbi:aldo/keto reductase [Catenulispora sp. NF23]|uniref:Aldo/keto reductase n=1 Tax=Catenulispora pinistramenti TaxID=2705254 RepID=A0ABS5KIF4_9ACTN|nr:aldo/keto reductase [Catenulispora pinistramenti]MBS2533978.1 aldo/keto reductase [Catenulispora pinistramenti]MBS2545645.1 aldo/keto reductase [Catenulispora pinistramenti]
MRYQTFGRLTGLRVSEYALGTANFSTEQAGAGPEGSRQIFEAFVSAGGTTFDTSNIYQDGRAETMLGRLLGGRRDDFVVITKYSGTRQAQPAPGSTGNGRKVMVRSLEASLRRLGTDYVDVYMPHFPDGTTPLEEILSGFDTLIRAGKIRHGGLSNFPAWRVAGATVRAELRGLAPLVGIQTEYSLAERSAERELLPMAQAHGLGMLLYSPLAGGLLTGKYRQGGQGRLSARGDVIEGSPIEGNAIEGSAQRTAVLDTVLAIADELGTSAPQVALAWLRRRAALAQTALVPIAGPRTLTQLAEYLSSLHLDLSEQHYHRLDKVSTPRLGTPHEDVEAALDHGIDGDRALLAAPPVPVV